MTEGCENCRFWDRSTRAQEPVGDCRRHAPLISNELLRSVLPGRTFEWNEIDDYVFEASAFPVTTARSWCGEYEPIEFSGGAEADCPSDATHIGAAIAKARSALDLSQVELASFLGVSPSQVSKWEAGKCAFPSARLPSLNKVLGAGWMEQPQ